LKRSMDLFFLLTLGLFTTKAFGWGKIGHEATASIAWDYLSPTTKTKISQLTGASDLLEASLWPDAVRHQQGWNHTKPFHFTNVPDRSSYYQSIGKATAEELAFGDALRALVKAEDVFRSQKSTKEQKLYALKFLVHFIGDIHQPLHTGRPQDLGGNQIPLNWFGRNDNLHSVWDGGIIRARLEGQLIYRSSVNEDLALYLSLLPKLTTIQVSSWQKGSFLQWHDESLNLRVHAYSTETMPNQEALAKYHKVVDQRIQMAGVRIAHLLNSLFDGRAVTLEGSELRRQLASLLGAQQSDAIALEPVLGFEAGFDESEYDCHHH
jgi:hypothetical protein